MSVCGPLAADGSTVIRSRFHAKTFWQEVARYRPTYFSLVPAMYLIFNAMDPELRPDTSSLRFCFCGAAPIAGEALAAFEQRYGVPVIEGYGLSECTVSATINPLAGPRKHGSVGQPIPGCELRIVDEHGEPLAQGHSGGVVVRRPNVMRGYLRRPDETTQTLRDGWLHTGDVGYLDADGYLFLVGRKKDMIIRGGENVYPKEIENALAGHPAVLEADVIG